MHTMETQLPETGVVRLAHQGPGKRPCSFQYRLWSTDSTYLLHATGNHAEGFVNTLAEGGIRL